MALVLIGFMGAGKSTAAAALAAARGRAPLDSDALLEARLGRTIPEVFATDGEAAFRAAEEQLVRELLQRADPRDVIALGGGAVLSERVRAALREGSHLTALLHVDPAVAWERLHDIDDGSERPLARERDAFLALHAARADLYEDLADLAMLWARTPTGGDYPVIVGDGLLDPDRLAAVWPLDMDAAAAEASRPHLVTDTTVGGLYGRRLTEGLGLDGWIELQPGETHKTLAGAEHVWSQLVAHGATRADHLVALGGGVVGDLAGFCAATYQRGIPVVHLPTTLVAQVDSAYGGKTGLDLPAAKNYIGTYHQPAGVIVDPGVLATLPPAELAAGWVEVLKTALLAGGPLWESVRSAPGCQVDQRTILACAATKLAIVADDERDAGARQALNLGHTIGHAIETATHYARYRHGEAVGLGLLAALRLSEAPDLREQVRELLRARGLPVTLERQNGSPGVQEILAAAARDKKRQGQAGVPFVLLCQPGQPRVGCPVPEPALRAAVTELIAP